jgi:hypothetical protein
MPAKARAVLSQSGEKVKPDANAESESACSSKTGASSEAKRVVVKFADHDGRDFPLSRGETKELGGLILREQKTASELKTLWDSKDYAKVVSCASSVILARRQFEEKYLIGKGIKYFGIVQFDILRYRALAYHMLNQVQFCIDDATAGLDLLASSSGQEQPKDFSHREKKISSKDANFQCKNYQRQFLLVRAECYKSLGDKDQALVDLRALVALERQMGYDLSGVCSIMTLMAEMKIGSPRPHYTDDEIRAWNKELQIKEYAIKNRICSNCGKNPSDRSKLKVCGGCKTAWFCGSECSAQFWPKHKLLCRHPVKKCTLIPTSSEVSLRAEIAKKGYYNVIDDNGPAVIVCDSSTGCLHESLSDQDVFFVDERQNPEAIREEVARQLSLRSGKI